MLNIVSGVTDLAQILLNDGKYSYLKKNALIKFIILLLLNVVCEVPKNKEATGCWKRLALDWSLNSCKNLNPADCGLFCASSKMYCAKVYLQIISGLTGYAAMFSDSLSSKTVGVAAKAAKVSTAVKAGKKIASKAEKIAETSQKLKKSITKATDEVKKSESLLAKAKKALDDAKNNVKQYTALAKEQIQTNFVNAEKNKELALQTLQGLNEIKEKGLTSYEAYEASKNISQIDAPSFDFNLVQNVFKELFKNCFTEGNCDVGATINKMVRDGFEEFMRGLSYALSFMAGVDMDSL